MHKIHAPLSSTAAGAVQARAHTGREILVYSPDSGNQGKVLICKWPLTCALHDPPAGGRP